MCYRSLCFIKVVCKSLLLTGITALVKTYSCQPLSIVNLTLVSSKLANSKALRSTLVNIKLVKSQPLKKEPFEFEYSLKSFYSESTVNCLIAANLFINALISINAPIADFFGIQPLRVPLRGTLI